MIMLVELAKLRLKGALQRGLVFLAAKLPTKMLDDARIAATEELARRGVHMITHRLWKTKVA